jgi:uroporphyrinogen decarboxylase
MAAMTKRERVMAALARRPVDRPPISFWRHVPELDHDPRRLADAMLAFHRCWDVDVLKVMSSGVYCVEDWGCQVAYTGLPNGAKRCLTHAVRSASDWQRIKPLDPGAGALGRELEALRLIVRGRGDDAPILMTVFSPLTIARKLAGEQLERDLRGNPSAVTPALAAIAATVGRYCVAALEAGADGLFFATQTATPELFTESEAATYDLPALRAILDGVEGRSSLTMLHAHGKDIFFDRLAALPAHAINWHDRVTAPSLRDATRRFAGGLVGGLAEWTTLRTGPTSAVAAEVADAIEQTGGVGLIVGPGCVLPLDAPDELLAAAVSAVKRAAR